MKIFTQPTTHFTRRSTKFLRIANLTAPMIMGIMYASASTYGQRLTLHEKDIPLREVIKEIKYQTGYDVLWRSSQMATDRKFTVSFYKTPLLKVLEMCFPTSNFSYKFDDHTIMINQRNSNSTISEISHQKDSVIFRGIVVDEHGKPLPGATIRLKGGGTPVKTINSGHFAIRGPSKETLIISYVGYVSAEISLIGLNSTNQIKVGLIPGQNSLGEVNIVTSGYQELPRERATGSFEVITKEQLLHSSDPNLVKRLEGITTSMNFNNQTQATNSANVNKSSPIEKLTIRGKNTLNDVNVAGNRSGQVLVVIDGIASPYSIDQINPNDVESITVLKDAASASIWGSRAANGVLVVTTKKGLYNKAISVTFNSNVNITDKINLFYKKSMSTSDYIDAQMIQFNIAGTNLPTPTILRPRPLVSPIFELLTQQKLGQLSAVQTEQQVNALRNNDIRRDYDQYIFRNAIAQNYSLALDGGTRSRTYRLSLGFDKTINNTVLSDQQRRIVTYSTTIRPLKSLEIQANINYTQQLTTDQGTENAIRGITSSTFYPFSRLADNIGSPIVVPKTYRPASIDLLESTYGDKILNMRYKPLEDINQSYQTTDYKSLNLTAGATYKINSFLSFNALYNYNFGDFESDLLYRQNSFYMRNLINYYTTRTGFSRNIPLGALYLPVNTKSNNQTLRGLLNINKNLSDKHSINAIMGFDIAQDYLQSRQSQYYGYNEETLQSQNQLNYADFVKTLWNDNNGFDDAKIPYFANSITDQKIRTFSLFTNIAYTYLNRYTFSFSMRKDQSSEFGKGTNKGGTPFYSFGTSWNIANEAFYNLHWLPKLQLRSTYGYNGNVNPLVSARPLLTYSTVTNTAALYDISFLQDVSNFRLRPERTAITNFGIDFGLRNNRLSGSLEFYDKKTNDLISSAAVDPSTGFNNATYNTASLHGSGIDLGLNSKNLQFGLFVWNSVVRFSYNRTKISKLYAKEATNVGQLVGGSFNVGYDLSRIFAFRWAGLDPYTGDPRGYVNGNPYTISSANATTAINTINSLPSSEARFFGSAVPVYYGSFRNTFNYGSFSISANILFNLGYYFRRPDGELALHHAFISTNFVEGAEYTKRWQKPGDEIHTNVPSLNLPTNLLKDYFYTFSEINVLKGDHVRLQEINIAYNLRRRKQFLNNTRIYANITNLGLLWRANKAGLDPEAFDYPRPRTIAIGFNTNF